MGKLNTSKLVKKPVQVKGQNGKTFTRMMWVNPADAGTSHGLRAIHNQQDLKDAYKDGVHEHPKMREALEHQGVDFSKPVAHQMSHEHPLFLPETLMSSSRALLADRHNSIWEEATSYDPKPHLAGHHHSGDDNSNEVDMGNEIDQALSNPPRDSNNETENDRQIREVREKREKFQHMIETREPNEKGVPKRDIGEAINGLDMDKVMEMGDKPLYNSDLHPKVADMDTDYDEDQLDVIQDAVDDAMFMTFGNKISKEGLEHVFSDPNGKFSANIEHIRPDFDDIDPEEPDPYDVSIAVQVSFHNPDTKPEDRSFLSQYGYTNRSIHRDKDGTLHVYNDMMSINAQHQGKLNIANSVYPRSEEMWKHLAGHGNQVEIGVFANISVGTYAWAREDKGFDFLGSWELNQAKGQLTEFLEENGLDVNETLNKAGYDSMDSLTHAQHFATLDDGYKYNLEPHGFKGRGHLGKAFMLTSKSSWSGKKTLDNGWQDVNGHKSVQEEIGSGDYDFDDDDFEDIDIFEDDDLDWDELDGLDDIDDYK